MTCDKGDFEEYAKLRQAIKDRETKLAREGTANRRAVAAQSLERLKPGDIVRVPKGKFAGLAVILDPGVSGGRGDTRPTVLTENRQVRRLSTADFTAPAEAIGWLRIPRSFNPKAAAARRDLASTLRAKAPSGDGRRPPRRQPSAAAADAQLARLRSDMRAHACHHCPDREEHARWAERWLKLQRETDGLKRRVDSRTNTIARQFDRVCALLEQMGYLSGDEVTPPGRRLAKLYTELDLLAAESLRENLWAGLDPAELAACVSTLTYESRRPDDAMMPALPTGKVPDVLGHMVKLWGDLDALERDHRLDFLREPDFGFALAAWQWASGVGLATVLGDSDLTAGDFVRQVRQLLDLLDQIAAAAGDTPLRKTARLAAGAINRGVVAYATL
jgi:ATP-dependent RNA helicase HelY